MPNFPNGFDGNDTLHLAVNGLRTRLTSAIDASTLTIPVVSTAGFPTIGFISIPFGDDVTQTEAIRYTSITSTQFNATQRGADGTSANAHAAQSFVDQRVIAAHHNDLKDTIIALEQFVGISGSENFLRVDDFGNITVSGLATYKKPNSTTNFVLIDPNGSITVASGSAVNVTRIQDQFITTGFLTTTGTVTAGSNIISGATISAVSGTITNLGGTGNVTYGGTVFGSTVRGTTITGTTGQFAGALSAQTGSFSTSVFAPTHSGTTGQFAGTISTQNLNVSSTATILTVTGTTARFAGTVSAQRGEFSTGLTVSGFPVRIDDAGSGGTVTNPMGSNLDGNGFDIINVGTLQATTVTGVNGQFGNTVSAQRITAVTGTITNLGGTNSTFTNFFGTSGRFLTVTGTTGQFAGALSAQSLNISNTITTITVTGTTGQFGGQVSAQTLFAPVVTGTIGRFATTVSAQTVVANSGTINNLGGINSTFNSYFGTTATLGNQVQAPVITGTNVRVGQAVTAEQGHFSTQLTVSGIPVQLQAVTSGAGGIVQSINGESGTIQLTGSNGNDVTVAGMGQINVAGFRGEFVSASGSLQTQITNTQNQINNTIIPNLPTFGEKVFITPIVDQAGGVRRVNEPFNNRSLVTKLKVSPTVTGVNSYLIQFYTKDTFDFNDLLEYEATASGIYVDNTMWYHRDADSTSELHLEITNTSTLDSTFQVELRFERFLV